ncbi:gephyrin-like molybdotransferase Glp [Paremcibacter congregatus]|uniref:molybdopterin molybdotransferase MoeA n=1 Tax=Paremcibacter congregatus TaxID=2043170 RepID=UPI003A8DFAAF
MPLMPVEQALHRITQAFTPLGSEIIPLDQALGRTTAIDHQAAITQPPFDASAMDGYAVRAEDLKDGPTELKLIGEAPAGQHFTGTVTAGTAVRIFTGGPVPAGADTVIMQENTTRPDDHCIRITVPAEKGRNIRPAGNDFSHGQILVKQGTVLTARHIGMMAAANIAHPSVTIKPRIALLSTGDELVQVGETPGPGQIINSNNLLLSTLISENGGVAVDLGIARDNRAALEDRIALLDKQQDIDLFITIGGASVGDHDLVQDVLGQHGLKVNFWKLAIRPGKPMIFGHFKDCPMIGLPGNPASAYVCAVNFLVPALHIMLGRQNTGAPISIARLAHDLPENGARQDYMRAHFSEDDTGAKIVTALPRQDSAKLSSLALANCLLIRPPHATAAKSGTSVSILHLTKE